jgi:deazaflavin-dependent oxidoreductase (nitroreductase family)
MSTTAAEYDAQVIDEFHGNKGRVGGIWDYHNLRAHPRTEIEVGRETIDVVAAEATGEERRRLFQRGADRFPDLAEHARKTDRAIPVIVLTPIAGA